MSNSVQHQDCSTLGFPVHYQHPELAQTHVHRVDDAIQPSHPLLSPSPPALNLPSIRVFSNESVFTSCGQSIGTSASGSVLPMNIQGWFPLELTDLISLLSKVLSRVFSSTTVQKHQFFSAQPSLWSNSHICTGLLKNHCFDYTDFCWRSDISMLSRFIIAFLPRRKHLLISWLQSHSSVISEPKNIKSITVSTFSPSIYHEMMGPDVMIFQMLY